MKKLIITALLAFTCLGAAFAREMALHKAVDAFVKNKDVTVTRSLLKNIDPATANTPQHEWQIIQYQFKIKPGKGEKLIEKLVKAYDEDVNSPSVDAAYQLSNDNIKFMIEYSAVFSPIIFGVPGVVTNTLLVSGQEKENVNTVVGVQWFNQIMSDVPQIVGEIYIIDRDPSFRKLTGAEPALAPKNENIRRLQFYSDKYEEQLACQETGANIIKASIFVVDDIIRNGSEVDKLQAQEILDNMLSSTPGTAYFPYVNQKEEIKDNARTLLNMIQRLSSDYNPAKYESTPNTFTIEGHIDDELWDIGYYIYTSDDEMSIITNESELIKVDGQNFFYQKDMDDVRLGRVRALFKDGTICSAWIDMLFVPGETAELSVHNGFYTLTGTGFYRQWSDAVNCMGLSPQDRVAYALAHIDEPGVLCFMFKEGRLDKSDLETIYNHVPESIKSSPYGVFLRKYL